MPPNTISTGSGSGNSGARKSNGMSKPKIDGIHFVGSNLCKATEV